MQNKNAIVFYLTQRPQRTQNFQSKLRCRWSSRSLRATENAKVSELSTPSVASLLVPPVSGGQSVTTAKRKSPLAQNTTSADTCHHWGSLRIVLSLKSHLCHRWPITFIVKHIHQSSSPFSCIFCIYSIPLYAKISKETFLICTELFAT